MASTPPDSAAADPASGVVRPQAVLRFAPSPTGPLHLGHALSALINLDFARSLGGRLLVRIEDTDASRCRPEYTRAILEDLAWLGIVSEGPVLHQSDHAAVYRAAEARLGAAGLLFPCFCSRQEIQSAARACAVDPDGSPLYPGTCRRLDVEEIRKRQEAGHPYALRLAMDEAIRAAGEVAGGSPPGYTAFDLELVPYFVACDPGRWGDVVIRRKEGSASYHLAVVVDDDRQGITHVVRGADLEASTDVHRLLQILLGLRAPLYHHHRLITAADGRKLSKRDGDTALAALRAAGVTARDIRRLVGL